MQVHNRADIVTANMGGFVDDIVRADIAFRVGMILRTDERARGMSAEQRVELARQISAPIEEAEGLNRPFIL